MGSLLRTSGLAEQAPDIQARIGIDGWLVLAGLSTLGWSYWPTLMDLVAFWRENPDYSAGALVPAIAVYFAWSEHGSLQLVPPRPWGPGLAALVAAQAVRFYGLLFTYRSLERLSIVLTIIAICLLLRGRRLTRRLASVWLFLALMFPLPDRVHNTIALPLQSFASRSAAAGLEMLGLPVVRQGNVLQLGNRTTVAVAEACSGLRMLTAFAIVAGTMALFMRRPLWQKSILVVSSVPVAVLANTVRLIVTVLVLGCFASVASRERFHDMAGLGMIPLAWAVLVLELRLLDWIVAETSSAAADEGRRKLHGPFAPSCSVLRTNQAHPASRSLAGLGARWMAYVGLAVLVASGFGHRGLLAWIDTSEGRLLPLRLPLSCLPLQVDGWVGQDMPLPPDILRILGREQYLNRIYVHPGTKRALTVYIGYSGQARLRIWHRPGICYPAHGFQEVSRQPYALKASARPSLPATLHEFISPQMGVPRVLVLATYVVDGRFVNDPTVADNGDPHGLRWWREHATYGARVQVSMQTSGDKDADAALMAALASRLIEDLLPALPIAKTRNGRCMEQSVASMAADRP